VQWLNDRLSMRDVRLATAMPVAAGQSESSRQGARDLIAAGAIDVCNSDASWIGGPTEWRRIAAVASAYEVEMGHHEEPQVASHLLASVPHGRYVECFHPDRDPIWWNLVANRPQLADGWLQLLAEPGLGWELDLEYVERHRIST
jgi:D-galactarolactone cycloisomerase